MSKSRQDAGVDLRREKAETSANSCLSATCTQVLLLIKPLSEKKACIAFQWSRNACHFQLLTQLS